MNNKGKDTSFTPKVQALLQKKVDLVKAENAAVKNGTYVKPEYVYKPSLFEY